MYWHARLDRAPDHVFRSAAARKRHDQIGLAFVEHPLIAQWASFLAEFVPLALRDCVVGLGGLELPTKRLSAASSEH
jgi:hypothetical protein